MSASPLILVDYIVLVAYMLVILAIGIYFARYQRSTEDFFVASRSIHWFPLFCSIWVSLTSANSFLGAPGYSYAHDLQTVLMPLTGLMVAPIIVKGILPILHGLKLISAYAYLERRYHLSVRLLGSFLFILLRGGWLASVIFAPSVAINAVTGIPLSVAVLSVGLTATAYTCLGGMKTVIWTDVLQFFVFVGGLLLVWVTALSAIDGGMETVWKVAAEHGRNQIFDFTWDFNMDVVFWWVIIGGMLSRITDAGTDQVALQRYFSGRSLKHSIRAIWTNALADLPLMSTLTLTGTVLFVFYQLHTDRLPEGIEADQVLPFFVAQELPAGVSGLFIAAIIAATMSSVDSGINCLAAATVDDFYKRLLRPRSSQRHYLTVSRILTLFWGVVASVVALFVHRLGQLIFIPMKLMNFFSGPLAGIFLLGFFTRRVVFPALLISGAVGLGTTASVALRLGWSPFLWSVVGLVPTIVIGYPLSYLFKPPRSEQVSRLTVWKTSKVRRQEGGVSNG